jgi:hypothetical protein
MDLQKGELEAMDWIVPDHDSNRWQALVNAVMNLWVP